MNDHTPDRAALRAVLHVTIETRENGDYYFDHDDLLAHVIPWVEGALEDRDDLTSVSVVAEPPNAAPAAVPVLPPVSRADVLREAAEALLGLIGTEARLPQTISGVYRASDLLHRMANEAQPTTETRPSCPDPDSHNWGCGCPGDRLPLYSDRGVDTPGCDCGHKGMGMRWHTTDCEWIKQLTDTARELLAEEPAVVAEQPAPATTDPRCANCTHPKRDHDGRADHRARYSPLVAGDPWCHACNSACNYVAEQPAAADTDEERTVLRCNAAQMHRLGDLLTAHGPHLWVVQPGMDPVHCPGTEPPQ